MWPSKTFAHCRCMRVAFRRVTETFAHRRCMRAVLGTYVRFLPFFRVIWMKLGRNDLWDKPYAMSRPLFLFATRGLHYLVLKAEGWEHSCVKGEGGSSSLPCLTTVLWGSILPSQKPREFRHKLSFFRPPFTRVIRTRFSLC